MARTRTPTPLPIRRITLSEMPFKHTAKCLICDFHPTGFRDERDLTRHMEVHFTHFCPWHTTQPKAFVVLKGPDDDLVVNAAEFSDVELQALTKLHDLVVETKHTGTTGRYTPGMDLVRRGDPSYRYARYEWLCQLLGRDVVETRDIWAG